MEDYNKVLFVYSFVTIDSLVEVETKKRSKNILGVTSKLIETNVITKDRFDPISNHI